MKTFILGISKIFLTTFLVASITFFLLHIMPGSPFAGDKTLPPQIIENLEAKYHLNEPILKQYYLYIKGLIHGDLGPSLKYINRSVNDILFASLPISITLGLMALALAIPIGLAFGIASAVYSKKTIGTILIVLITMGISVPNFLIAAILINIFSLNLKILPVALWETPSHVILPVLTLSFLPSAYIARIARTQMLEQLSEEYIKTTITKGLPTAKIIFKHAFKNCLISIITILGPIIAILITGSFVVEYIFAIPGMGRHFVAAFINRDYFLITGTAIIFSFILTTLNVFIDLLYKKIDPRIASKEI
ncbi:MAG: ABC transporter permease [Candidatus Melainabacteria bacterium]|nr:ABC transporter permease [Candidatus Melainabacteria bacterium]MBI3307836.1 ABC transporter permease [Candidatus Melainabacteria bacterium]